MLECKSRMQLSPAVMVLADPRVDAACAERNGLSFAELLRPFGVLRQLNGSVGGAWALKQTGMQAGRQVGRRAVVSPAHAD